MPAPEPVRQSLLARRGPRAGLRVLLPSKGRVLIGRDESCHVAVEDPRMSRQHCAVEVTAHDPDSAGPADSGAGPGEPDVHVRDLDSRNGTWINRKRTDGRTRLLPGDRLYVGNSVFELQVTGRMPTPVPGQGLIDPNADTKVFTAADAYAAAQGDRRPVPPTPADSIELDSDEASLDLVVQQPDFDPDPRHLTEEMPSYGALSGAPYGDETEELQFADAPGDVGRYGVTKLGPYRLLELLHDAGPFCPVFRAVHEIMANPCALKLLTPELAAHAAHRKRFQREARVTAQLDHENVRRMLNAGEQDGFQYLVYEYVDGPDLEAWVEHVGVLAPDGAVPMGVQLAQALDYMHGAGVIHRHLMPPSVLIDVDGTAVISDLGLAELTSEPGSADDLLDEDTAAFELAFRAPELLENPPRTAVAVDIYGLCATLYYALSGRPPFDPGMQPDALLGAIAGKAPAKLGELRTDLPQPLVALVMAGLRKDPRRRPRSAAELLSRLEPLMDDV